MDRLEEPHSPAQALQRRTVRNSAADTAKSLKAVRITCVGADIGSSHASLIVASQFGPSQDVRKHYQPVGMREW